MDGVRDSISGLPVVLDVAHHIVHLGYNFEAHHERLDAGFDTGQVMDFLLVTGAKSVHCLWEVGVFNGRATLTITKGVTVNANGTGVALNNSNDEATNVPAFLAYHTPTNPTGGTVVGKRTLFASSSAQSKTTAQVRSGGERVLARNTKYLFRLTALDDNIQGTIDFSGYERERI